jgi:predicted O-methyltransferase YrrM
MPLDITHPRIQQYAEQHTTAESELLKKINRHTHANVMMPRMLSGHLQGRLLSMISHMVRPTSILELGTYTGYSAICLAEGLSADGTLITIDANAELEDQTRKFLAQSPRAAQIDYRIGKAIDIIPSISHSFDLVFIDADKENNATYFDLIINKVTLGGIIIVDNVLWSGKVLETNVDKDTQRIVAFNTKIQADSRADNVLLPVRDGLMIIRKVMH